MRFDNKYVLTSTAIVSLLLLGCKDVTQKQQVAAPIVETVTMQTSEITPYHSFIGRTVAENDIDIMPRVNGELTEVHFKDGDMVEKDQVLFQIDPRPYKAALAYAKASLQKAQAELSLANREADRAKKLIKDKSISEQQYDDAIAKLATATASVKGAEASLLSSQLDLEFSTIRAPFSGRVGFSNYRVGDRITTLQLKPLVSLTQIDPIHFRFNIDEKLYRRIRNVVDAVRAEDGKLDVDLDLNLSDGSEYPADGKIYAVGNKIDLDTGSIQAEATFANTKYSLMPGEYGNLTISLKGKTIEGLLVPAASVQQDQSGDYVMVVNSDNVVARREIDLGQTYGTNKAVTAGLAENEKVIVKGLQKVRVGMKVQANDITVPANKAS
ncbi:efflux RND transporter periplasmic adaptor subunit [Vibrio diazotrophicus]|jgi:RND family efflux transporter MFP subunit|uniref:efflux RND transporter periplasmic adaptor subunit n=1 Tax=Vibrio diazotrophicus TaxID=685 RepID=UPI0005A68E16|nr:efflux RND transporter periplasmic adaptor subunit [Vibrio diazotrophicus]PNH77949.1 efflux RND transporter periplasmic adaptor subunit [Vibrio diazotrophicus]